VFAAWCNTFARFDVDAREWTVLDPPPGAGAGQLVGAHPDVFLYDASSPAPVLVVLHRT
jgi:hypothetical protein